LIGKIDPETPKHFRLSVYRKMIGHFAHNHLRQQTGSRGALLNRLRRLGGGPHGAVASILLAYILDHFQLRRNVFVALAGFFADRPQILLAGGAMLFFFRQIMHDQLTVAFGAAALLVIAGLYLVNKPDPKVMPDPNVPA